MKNRVDFIKVVLGVVLFIVAILLAYDAANTRQKLTYKSKALTVGLADNICGKIKMTAIEEFADGRGGNACPLNSDRKPVTTYAVKYHIASRDGLGHTFTYDLVSQYCPSTAGDRGCTDNPQGSGSNNGHGLTATVGPASEAVLEITRSSLSGSACGKWQTDFAVSNIDGQTCDFVFPNSGSYGVCNTNIDCPAGGGGGAPTASISGPTDVCVGKSYTYAAQAQPSSVNTTYISGVKANQQIINCPPELVVGNFCRLVQNQSSSASIAWTPSAGDIGDAYILVSAQNSDGKRCTGNPFSYDTSQYSDCGASSRLLVHVKAASDPACAQAPPPSATPPPAPRATNTSAPTPSATRIPTRTPTPSLTPTTPPGQPSNTPRPPTSTPIPTSTPTPTSGPKACNNACTANSQCATGFCSADGMCRNPTCESKTNCTCDTIAQGPRSCGATCTQDSQCASNFCDTDAGMCRNRSCKFQTDCTCVPTSTITPTPSEIIIAVAQAKATNPPPTIPSAGMPSGKWAFLAIPAALLMLGLIF